MMEPAYSSPFSESNTLPPSVETLPAAAEMARMGQQAPQQVQQQKKYFIQLGAFSQPENADKLRNRLEMEQNNPVEVSIISISGRELFRVRTGPFYNKADADEALQVLPEYPAAKIILE